MAGPLSDYETELQDALHRRGDPMTLRDFLAVLQEIGGGPTEALSAGERSFLLTHTDLAEDDLSADARRASLLMVAKGRAAAAAAVAQESLTTGEVAALLGRAEANVRRSRLNGDLYAPDPGVAGRALRFPRWQFTDDGGVVPGLRRIIAALPLHLHPLSVETFMTTGSHALGGQSPVRWLADGGPVEPVVRMADELGYE
jgi:hypothetical protein